MKHQKYGAYLAAGVTAFAVIAAAILLFFVIYHFSAVRALLELLAYILRPIFYGLVLAFLLLPVHRQIYSFLFALCEGVAEHGGRKRAALNFLAIVLSLSFAVLVVYVLLAMVLPQLYLSIVGLVNAVPEYIRIMQRWLLDFLADNPEIQAAVLPYYNSLAQSVEQWLSSDMLPNLESVNSTLDWLKAEILPQLTGVVSSVSSGVIALALLLKDILIAIIVSVYLLARKDVFAAQSKKIVYSVFRTDVADLLVEETRRLPHPQRLYQRQAGGLPHHRHHRLGVLQPVPVPISHAAGGDHRGDQHHPVFRPLHWGHPLRAADPAGQPSEVPVFCHFYLCAPAV